MRVIKENHSGISTLLAFALIPLSGFATDVYIPSLPSMAAHLHVSTAAVQLSLILFMVSGGISQLFVGSILDSFGRFRLGAIALGIFALASFTIASSDSIYLIYAMRIVQGIAVSIIVVGKRAYFMDIYSGDKLKHYTSLFSIIWATAPIIAPFLGGYLQSVWGWQSNFYFLGIFSLLILALELIFSGESLKQYQKFKLKPILEVYRSMIKTPDYTLGLIIIALSYAMLVVYGLTSPFIIEHVFHYSSVTTGYCSLLSGVALMTGGIISKTMIRRPLTTKIIVAISIQAITAVAMIVAAGYSSNVYTLMAFTLIIHMISGFVFNNFFAYCLGRFSKNAGIASGVTGGTMFMLASIISYSVVGVVSIKSQEVLGGAFLGLALVLSIAIGLFMKVHNVQEGKLAAEQDTSRKLQIA